MRRLHGFTLIELMIGVVIVALLVTVALPAYLEHLTKAKRAEGRNALLMAAQLQERFYSTFVPPAGQSIRYAQTTVNPNDFPSLFGLGNGQTVYSGEDPANVAGHYTLTVRAATAGANSCPITSCFVIEAAPNGKHAPDNRCKTLMLSSAGVRGTTDAPIGSAVTPARQAILDYCWGK